MFSDNNNETTMTTAKMLQSEDHTELGLNEMDDCTKSLTDLNIYDLMGEDFSVWLVKNKKFGYDLHVDNLETGESFRDARIHPCAIDAMAEYCRAFLACYMRAKV